LITSPITVAYQECIECVVKGSNVARQTSVETMWIDLISDALNHRLPRSLNRIIVGYLLGIFLPDGAAENYHSNVGIVMYLETLVTSDRYH
jgi:hypothetical protein